MKIVRFLGGLGNQMFQYAFYLSLKNVFTDVKADIEGYQSYPLHNGFEIEKIFGLNIAKADKLIVKLYDPSFRQWTIRKLRKVLSLSNTYYQQKEPFLFDDRIYTDKSNKLYWGYWQNELYFKEIADLIRKSFSFKAPLNGKNRLIMEKIRTTNSIAIHVRRGDYVKDPLLGGICDYSYYSNAINFISAKVSQPAFYIFSDDIAWCRQNLNLPSATYITDNTKENSYIDMQLMTYCNHIIIANSSFSWWAAWLNNNVNKIVIAPQKWINDSTIGTTNVTPPSWIRLQ